MLRGAAALAAAGSYLFFRHRAHFQNPLVPGELRRLEDDPALDDRDVAGVVDTLVERLAELSVGIYSPVPIARGLAGGAALDGLLEMYRYEMIEVDEAQRWSWQGRPVAPKVRAFFLENTRFQPALGVWYFEYRVNEDWWDKSYFRGMTPLRATALDGDRSEVVLTSGVRDTIDTSSFRLDAGERLFVRTATSGEVLVSDALRFQLLRTANEACDAIRLGAAWVPLRWPAGQEPT